MFWRDLMIGNPDSASAKLVADATGWLTAAYQLERDTPTWEIHPVADESLLLLSGMIDLCSRPITAIVSSD